MQTFWKFTGNLSSVGMSQMNLLILSISLLTIPQFEMKLCKNLQTFSFSKLWSIPAWVSWNNVSIVTFSPAIERRILNSSCKIRGDWDNVFFLSASSLRPALRTSSKTVTYFARIFFYSMFMVGSCDWRMLISEATADTFSLRAICLFMAAWLEFQHVRTSCLRNCGRQCASCDSLFC